MLSTIVENENPAIIYLARLDCPQKVKGYFERGEVVHIPSESGEVQRWTNERFEAIFQRRLGAIDVEKLHMRAVAGKAASAQKVYKRWKEAFPSVFEFPSALTSYVFTKRDGSGECVYLRCVKRYAEHAGKQYIFTFESGDGLINRMTDYVHRNEKSYQLRRAIMLQQSLVGRVCNIERCVRLIDSGSVEEASKLLTRYEYFSQGIAMFFPIVCLAILYVALKAIGLLFKGNFVQRGSV
ncbi:hypothetical protein K0U07_04465 [bacterium]|nr:hypothetical protein [bacterium]